MTSRRRGRLAVLPALLLACTACGTTVPSGGTATLAGPAGTFPSDGLTAPGHGTPGETGADGLALGPDGVSAAPGTVTATGGTGNGRTAPSATTTRAGAAEVTGVAAGGPIAHGPGVTATTISVGFPYAPNADQAQAALGNSAVTQGDPKRVVEALVADINLRGGVAGRKLVAVFHQLDAQSGETAAQQEQGLCSTFTEDHEVLAVFGATGSLLRDCLAKRGVINVTGTIADLNESDFRSSPTTTTPPASRWTVSPATWSRT